MIIYLPAPLVAILTFPGIILHEMSHRFFCDLFGIQVYKVCYFRIGNPSGYVIHEPISNPNHRLLVSFGPVVINIILSILLCFPAVVSIVYIGDLPDPLYLLILWLGLSIGIHGIPSRKDLDNLKEDHSQKTSAIINILFSPFYFITIISNFAENALFDLFIIVAINLIPAALIINLLPEYKPQAASINRNSIVAKMEKRTVAQKELEQYYKNLGALD